MANEQPHEKSNGHLRPSYEEGKVRDPRIEEMQGEGIEPEEFTRLVRRAATFRVVPKPVDAVQLQKGDRDDRKG